jgi:CHAT domain-containing protein
MTALNRPGRLLAVALLALGGLAAAPPTSQTPSLTREKRQALQADEKRLDKEIQALRKQGKLAAAVHLAEQRVALARRLYGKYHWMVALQLRGLAWLHEDLKDLKAAARAWQQRHDLLWRTHSYFHEDVVDARLDAADARRMARLTPEQSRRLARAVEQRRIASERFRQGKAKEALAAARRAVELHRDLPEPDNRQHLNALTDLGLAYHDLGDLDHAGPPLERALSMARRLFGQRHRTLAIMLNNLALVRHGRGDYRGAARLYEEALAVSRRAGAEWSQDNAMRMANLGSLYHDMGQYARAEPLMRRALAIYELLGPYLDRNQEGYSLAANNLAALYSEMGDYVRAEPLLVKAAAIARRYRGEKDINYAVRLNNLGLLYYRMSDYAHAEKCYRQALEAVRNGGWQKHSYHANILGNLAALYNQQDRFAKAEPLLVKARAVYKDLRLDRHPYYAMLTSNLAFTYLDQGKPDKAEPLFKQALALTRDTLGEKHPEYAHRLNSMAALARQRGNSKRAEKLYLQALQITRAALGKHHPRTAAALGNVAVVYADKKDTENGKKVCEEALQVLRDFADRTALVQSERQQLLAASTFPRYLGAYLDATEGSLPAQEKAYAHVLAWKGMVSARQYDMRRLRRSLTTGKDTKAARTFAQLEDATRRLASLSRVSPSPRQLARYRAVLEELSERIENLEKELSEASAEFRRQRAARRLRPADVRAALPADCALVDLLEYEHRVPPARPGGEGTWQRRLTAFVVRPGQRVRRVELGAALPITRAVGNWRRTFGLPGKGSDPGTELRRRLWQPLAKHLEGVKTVLISPDGATARLPWAALPGKKPGTFLLEEISLAVVPVPRLLPDFAAARPSAAGKARLLLVGAVDFDATPGTAGSVAGAAPAQRAGTGGWQSLPGTADEFRAVKKAFQASFRKEGITELRGKEATEGAVRKAAREHAYLHFATHGFFAPPRLVSALAATARTRSEQPTLFARSDVSGFHPGLLSGLVLAGANKPAQLGQDDGILTALEVAALDLGGVRLAVLSACETGLGASAGREGLLGLQRAFQIAGARSVVASLWKVPDRATQELMTRFYANLWGKKKMSKLEALRQAQLWLLKEGAKDPGLVRALERPGRPLARKGGKASPYYWAAFVLSGDWR